MSSTTNGSVAPPASVEAEQAALGAVLHPGADSLIGDYLAVGLVAEDFVRERHQVVFRAMVAMHRSGAGIDTVTVAERLRQAGDLDRAGGIAGVDDLAARVVSLANAQQYAETVRDYSRLRDLRAAGHGLVDAPSLAEANARVAALLELQASNVRAPSRIVTGGAVLDDNSDVDPLWGEGDHALMATGEALMIVGPQGVGKTTLAQRLVLTQIGIGPAGLLGQPVKPITGRVLYLAMDRPQQAKRSLRRMVTEADRETLDERLLIHNGRPVRDMLTDYRALVAEWLALGVETVVVDSLKDVAPGLAKDVGHQPRRDAAAPRRRPEGETRGPPPRSAAGGWPRPASAAADSRADLGRPRGPRRRAAAAPRRRDPLDQRRHAP